MSRLLLNSLIKRYTETTSHILGINLQIQLTFMCNVCTWMPWRSMYMVLNELIIEKGQIVAKRWLTRIIIVIFNTASNDLYTD